VGYVRNTLIWRQKNITLVDIFQTSPAHPSDRISVKIKILTVVKVVT